MSEKIYQVKFMKGDEGLICTWTIEGMDYGILIDFCAQMKKKWKCTSVAIYIPTKRIASAWSFMEMV